MKTIKVLLPLKVNNMEFQEGEFQLEDWIADMALASGMAVEVKSVGKAKKEKKSKKK